jgi:hypothetical protein
MERSGIQRDKKRRNLFYFNTDVTEKFFVRVDVTEEFPFLITKMSPDCDRQG